MDEITKSYGKLLSMCVEVKERNTPEFMVYWNTKLGEHIANYEKAQ